MAPADLWAMDENEVGGEDRWINYTIVWVDCFEALEINILIDLTFRLIV